MPNVPRNQAVQRQQIHQISQFNRNHLCNDCQVSANSQHRRPVQVHPHVIQAPFRLHRALNPAQAAQHLPVKLILGKGWKAYKLLEHKTGARI